MRKIFWVLLLFIAFQSNTISALSTEFHAWIKSQTPENLAKRSAEMTVNSLPMQIDPITAMIGVYAIQNVIILRIQVLLTKDEFIRGLKAQGKTLADYKVEFKAMVTNMGCTQETNMAYIAQGVDYKYLVSDKDFKKLFESSVTDCE